MELVMVALRKSIKFCFDELKKANPNVGPKENGDPVEINIEAYPEIEYEFCKSNGGLSLVSFKLWSTPNRQPGTDTLIILNNEPIEKMFGNIATSIFEMLNVNFIPK